MNCPHNQIRYQRRCDDCGRMVQGGITRTDIMFCFLLGMTLGAIATIFAFTI